MWDFVWIKLIVGWSIATASINTFAILEDLAPHDTHKQCYIKTLCTKAYVVSCYQFLWQFHVVVTQKNYHFSSMESQEEKTLQEFLYMTANNETITKIRGANLHWNMGVIWHNYRDAKQFSDSKSTKHLKHWTKNIIKPWWIKVNCMNALYGLKLPWFQVKKHGLCPA